MNIKSIKIYQAVYLNNKINTLFSNGENGTHKQAKFEIVPNVGVRVDNEGDAIIVPFPNIASIQLNLDEETKVNSKAQASKKA